MYKNYEFIKKEFIDEINSEVEIYKHIKSGARICLVKNDDDNKVFNIAFRTPPINNCGLTHILEHSVLCGSKKYPVKDPFVEMLKKSLNTFLNAFTFPDKTCYPVASKNMKDFCNLMDIYMDAVLNPQIYNHKEIFMQEGWHYDIDSIDSELKYNGVVYNEMKGAFSDPNDVLLRNIMHSLFKDTQYGLESGGDPKYIPDLTYEEFINFHKKYYHPSNSYIYLYGNMDFNERLEYLDKEYLSKYDVIDFDTKLKYQAPYDINVVDYYPSDELKNNTFLTYNLALPSTLNVKECLGMQILLKHLLGLPGSPLYDKLLSLNIAKDIDFTFDDGLLQPILIIEALGSDSDKLDLFKNTINETLTELSNKGLNHDAILSIINNAEFKARESYFTASFPRGLEISLTMLTSWLYDDDMPFDKLIMLKYFKELKDDLSKGYFEELIKKNILLNKHKAIVVLKPSNTIAKEEANKLKNKLNEYKNSLSKEELNALILDKKNLLKYQSEVDTKEALDKLPMLKKEDINPEPEKLNLEVYDKAYKVLYSDYHTNGIIYNTYYIDITSLDENMLKYVSLYCDLMKYLSTDKYTYQELNNKILDETGGISFGLYITSGKDFKPLTYLTLSFACINVNSTKAEELLENIAFNSNLDDISRIKEKMSQIKVELQHSISGQGHRVASLRALSRISLNSYNRDITSGIGYLDFITELLNDFDNLSKDIVYNLKEVLRLYSKKGFICGITCEKKDLDYAAKASNSFNKMLFDKSSYDLIDYKEKPTKEAILTDFDVNFNSSVGKFSMEYNGSMALINNIISMDYLWMNVRVKSGAYGCFLQITRNGYISFTSYRDPKIKETYDTYNNIESYINEITNISDDELMSYKIGTFGNLEVVLHNKAKGDKAQRDYISNTTYDEELKIRKEILNATQEDLKSLAPIFKEALAYNNICTIGNKNQIEDNKNLFTEVRNLVK